MPRIKYSDKTLCPAHLAIIKRANAIIREYQEAGYKLTLRQLYYQFVARDWIANKQSEYKRLGGIIGDGRLCGLIDWDALEDRGRNLSILNSWDGPNDIVAACSRQFRLDVWGDQPYHVEVWIEKEALIGVVEPVCQELRIGAFACKGYVSLSEMWDAGHNRLRERVRAGKKIVIFHMGDHDPSGIDMTRDIEERLQLLSGSPDLEIRRIALNYDQVEEYGPPPNPAKSVDPRFKRYEIEHGDESWELDALPPNVLGDLIRTSVAPLIVKKKMRVKEAKEQEGRDQLSGVAENWDHVIYNLNFGGNDE